jgi:hypothetical protein
VASYLEIIRTAFEETPTHAGCDYDRNDRNDKTPVWNQAEADSLLSEVRRLAEWAEGERKTGRIAESRRNAFGVWLEVCEKYARDRELEAARGWDALELLRGAAALVSGLARRSD